MRSNKEATRGISPFAEVEVRLARSSIAEFEASPKMTLKDALLCIGAVKSHLDRAGTFHGMFNPFLVKGTSNENTKKIIEATHRELCAIKKGK